MADSFEKVRELIRRRATETNLPSLAIGVARDGEILWEEAFGWADRERRIRATEHTAYSLASVSKPITATGLMALVEEGRVDLDKPANDYLGQAQLRARVGEAGDATVARVADHMAGLPLHYQFFYEDEGIAPPPRDLTIVRYGNLITAPGERYQYSNLGYGVLDYIIERVSGRSYAEFMRTRVFLPLGMTRTSVGIGPGLGPYAAMRYGADGAPYPFYDFDHPGASAVFSSVHDLLLFGMFHLKIPAADRKAILSSERLDQMHTLVLEREPGKGYRLGWGITNDLYGCRSWAHSGGMGGVNALLRLFPDEKMVVATLANANSNLPELAMHETVGALLPQYREARLAEQERQKSQESPPAPEPADLKSLVGRWEGEIVTPLGSQKLQLTVLESGDVHAELEGSLKALVNRVRFKDDWLGGRFVARLRSPDLPNRPLELGLDLKRREGRLTGGLIAFTALGEGEEGGVPGRRCGNALTHWCELSAS